jgi:hypothetical protein
MGMQLNLDKETVKKRPQIRANDWILRHDNSTAHKALSVKQFLAQKSFTEREHVPYSPDLALNDFWLFPKTKFAVEECRLQNTENIHEKSIDGIERYSTQESQKCFQQWQHRWANCIASERKYFEDDPSQ